ncbi:hypothetical protein D3C75_1070970 [compost metagenome]
MLPLGLELNQAQVINQFMVSCISPARLHIISGQLAGRQQMGSRIRGITFLYLVLNQQIDNTGGELLLNLRIRQDNDT